MGRPNRGPGFTPARRSWSRARAVSSTRAGSKVMKALRACADWHLARSACAYRSDVSAPCDMWGTASTSLRLQRSAVRPAGGFAPAEGVAQAADIAAGAVVPRTEGVRAL